MGNITNWFVDEGLKLQTSASQSSYGASLTLKTRLLYKKEFMAARE